MTAAPCTCEACTLANVTRPPVTIPGYDVFRGKARLTVPSRELHGTELRDFYVAQDECRATFNRLKGGGR